MNQNVIDKIKIVADIVKQHYEPERQDRCLIWCYRNFVSKLYPMSERTFWRYMAYATKHFGYKFENENPFYLDEVFSRMKPATIEKIKEFANNVLSVQTANKSKEDIYKEIRSNFNKITYSNFNKYVRIAEIYLGYSFNF